MCPTCTRPINRSYSLLACLTHLCGSGLCLASRSALANSALARGRDKATGLHDHNKNIESRQNIVSTVDCSFRGAANHHRECSYPQSTACGGATCGTTTAGDTLATRCHGKASCARTKSHQECFVCHVSGVFPSFFVVAGKQFLVKSHTERFSGAPEVIYLYLFPVFFPPESLSPKKPTSSSRAQANQTHVIKINLSSSSNQLKHASNPRKKGQRRDNGHDQAIGRPSKCGKTQ